MRTIIIASRKGGVGKTTILTLLAVEAARAGAGPVAMIDLDSMKGLTLWWEARQAEAPVLVASDKGPNVALAAAKASGASLVLIDTAPSTTPVSDAVMARADLVLVPVQPSPHDLRAAGATVELARRARRPLVFIINRTKPRVKLTGEAAIALSQYGRVAPAMLADRVVYAAAGIDGRTAPEIEPGGAAATETAALWKYITTQFEDAE